VGDGSPPVGYRGKALVRGLGDELSPPETEAFLLIKVSFFAYQRN